MAESKHELILPKLCLSEVIPNHKAFLLIIQYVFRNIREREREVTC